MLGTIKDKVCSCFRKVSGRDSSRHHSILKGKSLKIPSDLSLMDYFQKALSSGQIDGHKTALIHEGAPNYSYSALEEMSTKLAKVILSELESRGWVCNNEDSDIVIAFCLGSTEKMVLSVFAALKLGATYLPIDSHCPEENLVSIVTNTKPVMIITEKSAVIQTRFSFVAKLTIVITIDALFEAAKMLASDMNNVIPLRHPRDLEPFERTAAIYYSAGTTGQTRGSRIGHLAILNRIMWQWDAVPYTETDVACLMSQTVIHTSIPDLFAPLLAGIPLVILNKMNVPKPDFVICNAFEHNITQLTVSSEVLSSILKVIEEEALEAQLEEPEKRMHRTIVAHLARVNTWFCCGDLLTTELCERFFKCLHPVDVNKRAHRHTKAENDSVASGTGTSASSTFSEPGHSPTVLKRRRSTVATIQASLRSIRAMMQREIFSDAESAAGVTKRHPTLVHIYGSTETTADCAFEIFENMADLYAKIDVPKRVPLGVPIANTQIFLMNPHAPSPGNKKVLGQGVKGEICVTGLCLASGYTTGVPSSNFYQNPIKSMGKGYEMMFRTDDLGLICESFDGHVRLYYVGRCDSIIEQRGKHIDLNDIGRTIKETGLVEQVELFVYHQHRDDQVIVAAVVLKPDVEPTSVSKAIQSEVSRDTTPEIYPVHSLEFLADGRLDRNKLVQNYKLSRRACTAHEWVALQLPAEQLEVAKILCAEVAASLGVSQRFVVVNFRDTYWELGGNSQNTVILIERLRLKGYKITLDDFISSPKLLDVVDILLNPNSGHAAWDQVTTCRLAHSSFKVVALGDRHREDVFRIICTCYPEKSDLALHVSAEFKDYESFLDDIWDTILKDGLSTVVLSNASGKVIAVNINIDSNSNAIKAKKISKPLRYVYELYEYCENTAKIRLTLNKRKLIQPFMIATVDRISPDHNVLITEMIIKDVMDKGSRWGFTHLFLMNTLPLIRQLCKHIFNCETMFEYPIHQFTASDKTKPFSHASVHYTCSVFSKPLPSQKEVKLLCETKIESTVPFEGFNDCD